MPEAFMSESPLEIPPTHHEPADIFAGYDRLDLAQLEPALVALGKEPADNTPFIVY